MLFDAREYFDSVRFAAASLEAAKTRRETMTLFDHGSAGGRAGCNGDPTSAQAMALAALEANIAALEGVVGEACLVINAIGKHVSQDVALAFTLYYIERNAWDEIALEMRWSISTLYRRRIEALSWVDKIGLAAAREFGKAENERALVR